MPFNVLFQEDIIITTLPMKKVRFRDGRSLAPGHTDRGGRDGIHTPDLHVSQIFTFPSHHTNFSTTSLGQTSSYI